MRYNIPMMKEIETLIIGGGAAGLLLASLCPPEKTLLLERGQRVGRKLSATGNGQGNLTNEKMDETHYFSFSEKKGEVISRALSLFGEKEVIAHFEKLGGLFLADGKGRVYPTGRQASALTDLLRKYLDEQGTPVYTEHNAVDIQPQQGGFFVTAETADGKKVFRAKKVVVCAGGKAAKNFGTDGSAYELCKKLGHTITRLYPSLVQLKTETAKIKTLKGIRIANACVTAYADGEKLATERGDIIFTDYGVSGDAIFRISAFLADKIEKRAEISINLLPEVALEKLEEVISQKWKKEGKNSELLCGILNNQVGRALMKSFVGESPKSLAEYIRRFSLSVLGTLGYDYAQVTKGGIPLDELNENLESKLHKGLYFAGEIVDVDGECGGYNLQWAFSSAAVVARAVQGK